MPDTARSNIQIVWRCGAVFGTALLIYAYIARFLLPYDLFSLWLPSERIMRDNASFDAGPMFFCVYGIFAAASVWLATTSLRVIINEGRIPHVYLLASTLTAVAGIALSAHQQPGALGGQIIHFFWWGFGLIWLFTNALSVYAWRTGSTIVSRDWAIYSVGLAFVPVTALPQVPLWALLDAMTLDHAMLTATTSSFAAHYVVAHFVILEVLDRRRYKTART